MDVTIQSIEISKTIAKEEENLRKKNGETHKSTDGGQELALHRLPLREPAADEDRVVGDLVWDLVREARERRRRADQRRRVERRRHAADGTSNARSSAHDRENLR